MNQITILIGFFLFSFIGITLAETSHARFLPINNLHRYDRRNITNNIDEATFNAIIQKVYYAYAPIVKSHGARLVINRRWDDATVNAYADRNDGNWNVTLFGGLARRPEVTPDGFMLVACHELGHHLAGFPFYSDHTWAASVEGESDYYATQACARLLWRSEPQQNAAYRNMLDPETRFACTWKWRRTQDQDLCFRAAFASISLSTLLSRLAGHPVDPTLAARDRNVVPATDESHPDAQCRLDTMLNGALCNMPFNMGFIPGLDPNLMASMDPRKAEAQAIRFSCRQEPGDPRLQPRYGARPLCWFKSNY